MRRYAGSTGRTAQGEWVLLMIRGWNIGLWAGSGTGESDYGVAFSKQLMFVQGEVVWDSMMK